MSFEIYAKPKKHKAKLVCEGAEQPKILSQKIKEKKEKNKQEKIGNKTTYQKNNMTRSLKKTNKEEIREKMEQTNKKQQPEKTFRAGVIAVNVWANKGTRKDGQEFEFKTVKAQRGYKDNNDEWQNTDNFRVNDLPKVTYLLEQAYAYLISTSNKEEE